MKNLGYFFKAHFKSKLGRLNDSDRAMSEARLAVCQRCEHRNNDKCGLCGCHLFEMSIIDKPLCKAGKWQ